MSEDNNWLDEPAFQGVCPELTAYPEFREAYVKYVSTYKYKNKFFIKEETKWPFTMNTGR